MSRPVVVAVILALGAANAAAQHPHAADAEKSLAAPANLTLGTVAGVTATPSSQTPPSSTAQLLLDATNDKKVGTVAIGWKNGQQSHLQLTFSGPVDESTSEATPASLLGLANGAQAKLSFNRLNWRGPSGLEQMQIQQLCAKLAANGITDCNTANPEMPVLEGTALRQLLHVDDIPWLIGGDVSVGRNGFRFLEPGSLAAQSLSKENVSATGRLGIYVPALGFAFGSYSYRRGWAAGGRASDICQPIANTNATQCQSAVIGPPVEKSLSVVTFELRKFFAGPVATTPSLQIDLENDVRAVDVPIYFLRTSGNLTGGVRFNWRSDTKETTAVVFIGTAIGLLPQ